MSVRRRTSAAAGCAALMSLLLLALSGPASALPTAGPAAGATDDTVKFVVSTNNPDATVRVEYDAKGTDSGTRRQNIPARSGWSKTLQLTEDRASGLYLQLIVRNTDRAHDHAHVSAQIYLNGTLVATSWAGGYAATAQGTFYHKAYESARGAGAPPAPPARPAGSAGFADSAGSARPMVDPVAVTYRADANNTANRPLLVYNDGSIRTKSDVMLPWSQPVDVSPSAGSPAQIGIYGTSETYLHTVFTARLYVRGVLVGQTSSGGYDAQAVVRYAAGP